MEARHIGGYPMSDLIKFEDLSLEALSEVAKEAFEECNWALEKALDKATKFGRILLIVRRQVQHGQWTEWCEETFGDAISLRKIQRYMQIANASDQTLLEGAETIDEALGMISEPRKALADLPETQKVGQQAVQAEAEPREPKPAANPRSNAAPSSSKPATEFDLGSSLDEDRSDILDMAADYTASKQLKHFIVMLRKVAADLEVTAP